MSCAIEILSFQNFYEVLKTCSAGRKDFFDTLEPPALPGALSVLSIFCCLAPAKSAEFSFTKGVFAVEPFAGFPAAFQYEPPQAGYEARTRFPASHELRSAIRRNPASPLIKMRFAHGCRYRVLFTNEKNQGIQIGCPDLLWSGLRGSNSLPGIPRIAFRNSQEPYLTSD